MNGMELTTSCEHKGNQDLTLTATSAATVALTGSALAINSTDSCEEAPYYGTMTQEIYNEKWQDNVIAIAVENSEIALAQEATETLVVRAVFGGAIASQRQDNSNFTFAIENTPTMTATGTEINNQGVITAGNQAGFAVISVSLTDYENVDPAYVYVTVT